MCLGGQVVTRLSRLRFKPVVPSWRPLYVRGVPVAGAVLLVPVIKAITLRGLVDRKPHVYITEDSRDPLITLRCCREARSLCDHGQHGLCAWGGKSLPDLVGDGSSPSCPSGGRHACGASRGRHRATGARRIALGSRTCRYSERTQGGIP